MAVAPVRSAIARCDGGARPGASARCSHRTSPGSRHAAPAHSPRGHPFRRSGSGSPRSLPRRGAPAHPGASRRPAGRRGQPPAGTIRPDVGPPAGLAFPSLPSQTTAPEAQMSVERTHAGHQTRYELRDEAGLSCVLTYTADPDEPATWKILLPGPGRHRRPLRHPAVRRPARRAAPRLAQPHHRQRPCRRTRRRRRCRTAAASRLETAQRRRLTTSSTAARLPTAQA